MVKILFYKCKHTIKLYTQNNNKERLFSPNSTICNKIIKLNIYLNIDIIDIPMMISRSY